MAFRVVEPIACINCGTPFFPFVTTNVCECCDERYPLRDGSIAVDFEHKEKPPKETSISEVFCDRTFDGANHPWWEDE